MKQRTTISPWWSQRPRQPGTPIRLLVESDDPVLAVSDFTSYREAGIDVALCAGPAGQADDCPLVRGEHCELADGADVVLFQFDLSAGPGAAVLAAMHASHPDVAVLVSTPRAEVHGAAEAQDFEPLPFPMSVQGQVRAIRSAARRH